MIDQVDKELQDWIRTLLKISEVSLDAPSSSVSGQGVSVYLMELVHDPPVRGMKRPPLQFILRYLVTTWASDSAQAHRILGTLVFAAMEKADLDVELNPVPVQVWTAFGVSPRPSFFLRVPVRQERPEPTVPLVRKPLVTQHSSMSGLDGFIYGPGNVPVMDAQVNWTALNLHVGTDYKGHFHFSAVPSDVPIQLSVHVKGRNIEVMKEPVSKMKEPLIITLEEI